VEILKAHEPLFHRKDGGGHAPDLPGRGTFKRRNRSGRQPQRGAILAMRKLAQRETDWRKGKASRKPISGPRFSQRPHLATRNGGGPLFLGGVDPKATGGGVELLAAATCRSWHFSARSVRVNVNLRLANRERAHKFFGRPIWGVAIAGDGLHPARNLSGRGTLFPHALPKGLFGAGRPQAAQRTGAP